MSLSAKLRNKARELIQARSVALEGILNTECAMRARVLGIKVDDMLFRAVYVAAWHGAFSVLLKDDPEPGQDVQMEALEKGRRKGHDAARLAAPHWQTQADERTKVDHAIDHAVSYAREFFAELIDQLRANDPENPHHDR